MPRLSLAVPQLGGQQLDKATGLRDAAAQKLKPAEKTAADQRLQRWHPVRPAQPQP